jgi:DNA mismatch endonuclease Vsr
MYIKKQSQHLPLLHGRCLPADRLVHSKETHSYNMSRIKGKNTKSEMLVRRFLHANGYRYKLHDKSLPGKPDIVFQNTKR